MSERLEDRKVEMQLSMQLAIVASPLKVGIPMVNFRSEDLSFTWVTYNIQKGLMFQDSLDWKAIPLGPFWARHDMKFFALSVLIS
jgi:hypothetical protein